jgi:hypothetical protein
MCFSKQTFAHLSHISKGCSIIPLTIDSRLGLDNSPTNPLVDWPVFLLGVNVHGGFTAK